MHIISANFIKGAVHTRQFPETGLNEFAFFGKSNAGKSSLINMLVNRKNLVKTGSRPGMTQEINFFSVQTAGTGAYTAKKAFCLADLPGYGYAQVPQAVRTRIDRMLYEYADTRSALKLLFFLMDIRRTPTEVEQKSLAFFENLGIKTILVGTKIDKISKNEQQNRCSEWINFFKCSRSEILLTSAPKKSGREQLLRCISAYL